METCPTETNTVDMKADRGLIVSHPGYGMLHNDLYENFGGHWNLSGLRTEDYVRYAADLVTQMRRWEDDVVAVTYPNGCYDDIREFLGDLDDLVDVYIRTTAFDGHPYKEGEQALEQAVNSIRDGGILAVAGELHGLCPDHTREDVEELLVNSGKDDVSIRETTMFPEDPVKYVDDRLYWESDQSI